MNTNQKNMAINMTRTELQLKFFKETGTELVNSQGEIDIDYVSWLEDKVISAQFKPEVEVSDEEELEAIADVIIIANMNPEDTARELIRSQFSVKLKGGKGE